jgi:hypothetical protein
MRWGVKEWAAVAAIVGLAGSATLALGQSILVAPVEAKLSQHEALQAKDLGSLSGEVADMRKEIKALYWDCVHRGGCKPPEGP